LGGACSTYGGKERFLQGVGGETWGNETTEDSGVDGRIILRWILSTLDVGMEWIDLAQDRDRWRTCKRGNYSSGPIKCGEFLY
jgi:hypothetical protein